MWHKPQLMTAVSDLLFVAGAAALLVAAVVWSARLPWFPLREVVLMNELQEVRRSDLERSLSGLLRGNFFSVNLDALRQALERLPWVRHAEVRRQWPSGIEITVEEHRAVAHWGESGNQLVNTYGEVFAATSAHVQELPLLSGPSGSSAEMLTRYGEFSDLLDPAGLRITRILLSPRLAWQLQLENGLRIELGREQQKAPTQMRLGRFVQYYPTLLEARRSRPLAVDMRYPNGFALRYADSAGHDARGKQ